MDKYKKIGFRTEEEEEEVFECPTFECPTCGRGRWVLGEIEDNKCPLCMGEIDEDDFYEWINCL